MDQDFQTSFIPKKPMIEHRATPARPVGLLSVTSFFILLTVLVVSGGVYFYRGILTKDITKMQNDLELSKGRFEQSKIIQLQTLDKRLLASTEILSGHIAVSPIFAALQAITMKSVRYTKFDYSLEEKSGNVLVKMHGQATGYRSIALQSDLFTENNKHLIDPVFSNLSLDDKGNVIFDLEFLVDPSFVNYKQTLLVEDGTLPDGVPESSDVQN